MNGKNMMNGNGMGHFNGTPEPIDDVTGRYLVLFREDAMESGIAALTAKTHVNVTRTSQLSGGVAGFNALSGNSAIVFDKLGVAVVDTPLDQVGGMNALATEDDSILAIEAEHYVKLFQEEMVVSETRTRALPVEYLLGYQESVNTLIDRMLSIDMPLALDSQPHKEIAPVIDAETRLTWGLQVTGVGETRFTGNGVRLAILDTGIDFGHPDFVGRAITNQSFIPGENVQDGHGHGTHVAGTACGPRKPQQLPRYGIAHDAELFVGKVLSNMGSGTDQSVLAGIQWAIENNCDIVSMSLGSRVAPGQSFSPIYEAVAKRALAQDTLIIAAAGNDSRRPNLVQPVGRPANSPSILAVAALERDLQVAVFSNGGLNPSGGQVDISAPGVDVYSSVPRPDLYDRFRGTSMATPHVAGIAALHAEANPGMRGAALGWLLLQSSQRLPSSADAVGVGLVQAP